MDLCAGKGVGCGGPVPQNPIPKNSDPGPRNKLNLGMLRFGLNAEDAAPAQILTFTKYSHATYQMQYFGC